MTYEEWRKQRNEGASSPWGSKANANYNDWLVRSGKVDIESIGNEINERVNTWLKNNENYILNAQDRFSVENPSYRADASDWLSTVTTQKSNFEKEAEGIKSMLDQYKGFFNEDYINSVTQALDGNLKVQGEVISNSTKDLEYWSQWETEDAYNEYIAGQKDYEAKLNYDLGAGQKEIDWLQSIVDEYDKVQKPVYSNTDRGASAQAKADAYNAQIGAIAQKYGISYEDAKAQLSEKSAYHTLAGRIQKAEELASVADVDSVNYDPEFEKYANQGKSMDDGNTPWMFFGNTVADNPIEAWRRYYADSPNVEEDYGAGKIGKEASFALAMTEDEVKLYNYYLAKEGKDKADEYLDLIAESVNSRVANGLFSQVEGKPVLEYAFAVAAGLDQFGSGIAGWLADGYTPTSATQIASGMIREDLAGGDDSFKIFGNSLGQIGYDVLNTTSNMLPSILVGAVTNPIVGAGLLGASAGGSAKAEMLNLGYSKEQANTYGAMVAIAETGMEYLLGGITKLGGKLPDGIVGKILTKVDNAFARTAIKIGGSMASEGFEEGLQTVIEPWLKEIATGVDWDDPTIDEVLYSSLLGALSAFGLEGAGTVAGEVKTYKSGKTIRNTNGGVGKLQELATNTNYFSADSVAYKIASKVNAQTDAYTIGRLLNEVGGTISEQNLTDIVNGLVAKGIRKSDATKLARQFQAILNADMNISDEAKRILNNVPGLNSVLRENLINANTTVYQRTKAYSDLMNLAEETANKKSGKTTETKVDSLESLANAMVARGVDGRYAGVMATGIKSELDSAKPSTEAAPLNIFEQNNMNTELQRIASEVATGSRTSASQNAVKKMVDSASDVAAEKLGVEGKYTSSNTGANRLASNKQKVNIVGVDSIKDGTLKLKLNDGTIVDADEIDFSSSDEALVYEAVTNMGVSSASAWEILKGYNPKSGQPGTIYAMGALEAYTYGHNGIKVDGMSKNGFSALLSPTQQNTANRLGDIDASAKVEAKQKTIDKAVKSVRNESKSKHKAIPLRKGQTVFEGDRARLTELQEKQFGVLEKVAEGLGVTFHIFESKVDAEGKRYYTMPNGKITSANGWYDTKTGEIWIDLHAGNDGQGTMIFTAAHELTHFIRQWSPAKFKVFADFLFEQYGKKGQDVNQLIREQIQKAANNGRSISWDEAYEEVIADSCETFLRDSKASEKIAALREKDTGLANKIKSFLGQMLAKMRKLMADLGLTPETKEGKMVAEMTDSLQKLYDLWTDALADAGKAYSTLANIDFDTDSVAPMLSERTWTASEYVTEREETAKKISKALGVDIKTAYKYIDDINSVARLIADDRARLDYEPNLDEHATVLKPNSDYKYSVDMSTLCAKRLLFTGTFDAIQRALPNTVFDSEDIVALREMMQKRGYEVACGICYVESTRREIGRITQDFINSYIESQKTGKPMTRINSEGKAVELKKTKDQMDTTIDKSTDKFFADNDYTPTLADLNTTDIDIVKRDHPLVYEAYLNFMNARGQAKPKLLETRAEYKGEILKHFKAKSAVNARNNAGGLRLQSFSDFEVPHLIDMMQIVMDMSRVGLKSQAYTKVPAFAEVFGDTGVKINLSLIAKGDGLDANGNLVFDDVEGINHNEAFKLRDKYSKNVGTILVGKTDAHIIAAMADSRIDYIIPFHKSSWKESLYDALGLTGYADYTDYQNEKPIDKSRTIKNFDPSEYWDFSKSGDENAQIYLEKCREDGRIPKFPQFQGYPGYWKLLIDFKMYDNDGVGSPQEVVRPTFNTEASERILSEYKGGHRNFPVAKDVVEDFVREHKDSVKFSDRDSEGNTLSKEQQEFFKDSKVRDSEGRLTPVYHGTPTGGFTEFQLPFYLKSLTSAQGAGFYFTDKANARQYMRGLNGKSVSKKQLYKVYLNITNPLEITEFSTGAISDEAVRRIMARGNYEWGMNHTDIDKILRFDNWDSDRLADMVKVFNGEEILTVMKEELGYDGVHYSDKYGDIWVAWDKTQIKNTNNKTPTSNPDIRYSERKKKVDDTVDKAIKQKGNLGVKYNQERISEVPADVTAIVDAASDGRINLTGKYVAINGSDVWHEYERHTDVEKEVGRRQIPLTAETIKEAVMAIYEPDVVESLFSTSQNPTQRQSFAYAKKSPNGYYIVVEAVGGKTNPNVVPVEILQFSEAKWDEMISKGKTLGELLFENDTKKRNSLDVAFNKKNRVIVAQFASKEAIANTPHSPRFTNSIPHFEDSVNSDTEKNSLRNVEPIETADYVKMYHHFGSTKNYDVAGYILGNGMMLDFSGKHWGDDYSTSRQVDHRDIQETLGNRGSNNGVNAMIDMIGNGNIRLMPEVGGINLAVKPNSTQMSQLRGYINHFKGEVTIDIDEVGGDTIHSFSYTRGTSSAKVLADIKAYFDEGVVPKQKEEGETDIHQFLFSERESAPPKKTKKAYKLMRLVDEKLYPLFIGNNEEISVGTWYNADSPNLSQLKNLAPGTHLVDMKTGEAMTWDEYAEKYVPKKNGKPARSKPSKDDVHWANDNGYRFMHIEEKAGGKSEGTMLKKYGDTRAYYNWGVNGSSKTESGEGSASLYALRPGWHFGEVPSMHQIGYDGEEGETVRLDNQVWVEVEMSADVDYNAEAEANWSGDIPTHIPTNGYYRFATNPTQKKTKGGNTANDATKADWFVAGAFKVNRILSDSEADSIVENYNKENGKNVPLDYRRNYGRVFNAETMSIEDSVRYSDRSPSSVSTRTLLANALETTAQNDIERTKLEQYKSKIELIESEYAKLSEIKKKANDIRFTKGRTSAETKQMKALDFEANQIANRINVYDRQLLNLESTTALKNVLQREKELARRKEAKKGKEALARQKEREAKTIRTLMDKNTESRKKAAERADKTTMRGKIRKVVKELNTLLKNSNKKKNIKEEEKTTVATALALAEVIFNDDIRNEDIVRLGVDSVTEQESILLNEYRDLLDSRDALIAKIESTHGNGIVKENTLTEVGSMEEALAKVKNRISTLNSKLSDVFERERARLNKSTMNAVFDALITEYSNLANSDNDYIKNAYSEVMKTRLETLKKDLDGKIAKDMSIHQLAEVYDTFKAIKHMISTSNNIFREGRAEDLATYVSNTQGEIFESTTEPKDRGVVADALISAFNEFSWNNLRPVDAFERLGSKTFEKLFWDYVHGMGVATTDVAEAGEVIASAREKYGYSKWNMNLADTTYTTREGLTFKPSLADKLSIYAFSKREKADGTKQAMDHMVDGGFTYDTGRTYKDVEKGKTYVRRKLSTTYRLSEGNIKSIIDSLTQEQKAYVDAILPYLTDMGNKGNEVSMTLYGIELFGEKVYFPLQSSADYLSSTTQELGATQTMSSLANSGFTKQTTPGANNPIVLRGFDDVVLEHIEKMSNYHGLVIPIENLRRVFDNVSRDTEKNSLSTKALIGSRYGVEAQKYFAQLLIDLNGGMSPSGAKSFLGKLFSKGKAMAVSANLSVVAQQYFSIIRAMEVVNPKYFTPFLNGEAKSTNIKEYEELKKYAPIAIIKEMNGFDVGSSGRVKNYIGSVGARKDAKYIKDKIDDVSMWGAGKMDELGWVTIWKAVKAEVASEQKLAPGTEEFYKACNTRFTEVVTKTQVYDSVASRSGYMRSKHDAVKYATSFMGEPTVVMGRYFINGINLVRAIKSKDSAKIKEASIGFVRAAAVIAIAQTLGNLAKSLIYAGRDDEEDEALLEKWAKNFAEALVSDLNPLNSLPFTRDIMSVIEGWDVERPDLTLIADTVTSAKKMFDDDITLDDTLNFIGAVGNLFGVPIKNVIREIKSAINGFDDIFVDDINPTDMGGAFIEGITGAERTKQTSLYNAIVRGDTSKIEAIKGTYKTDSAYKSAVKQALRDNDSRIKEAAKAHSSGDIRSFGNYIDTIVAEGHFDREMVEGAIRAEESAFNTKINKAAEAKNNGEDAEYKKIVRELRDSYRGIYSQDDIVNLITKAQEEQLKTKDDEDVEEATSIYKASDINDAFESGDTDMALEVIDDLFNTKVTNYLEDARKEAEENGKTFNEKKARQEAESKAKSSIRSSMTSYWKPLYKAAYKSGNTAEKERIERILKASGLYGNASEVIKTCREWRTERD